MSLVKCYSYGGPHIAVRCPLRHYKIWRCELRSDMTNYFSAHCYEHICLNSISSSYDLVAAKITKLSCIFILNLRSISIFSDFHEQISCFDLIIGRHDYTSNRP
jgi:hypothetical protein